MTQHKLTSWHGIGTDAAHLPRHAAEVHFAAHIDPPLAAFIAKLARDDRRLSIAEINRRTGRRAEEQGLRRPSYAAVRLLVGDARMGGEERSWTDLLIGVASRAETPDILVDKYVGLLNKHRPEDYGIRHERR